jgi:tRNA1(Val) A37 N6-methylase TrmN6
MNLNDPLKGEDETLDTFYHGRIRVFQKTKGYRFSLDAPLLADFIQTKSTDRILELGAGNGIISLLLSIKPFSSLTALEIQEPLVERARRNVRLNNLEDRITIIQADLRDYSVDKPFDLVFSNPPYIKRNAGHLSALSEKSVAKHELKCTISDIMQKTEKFLKTQGAAYFIYPATREEDFMQAVEETQLRVRRVRYVYPFRDSAPNFFLVSLDFASEEAQKLRPLILYEKKGEYTEETQEIFAGRIHDPAG